MEVANHSSGISAASARGLALVNTSVNNGKMGLCAEPVGALTPSVLLASFSPLCVNWTQTTEQLIVNLPAASVLWCGETHKHDFESVSAFSQLLPGLPKIHRITMIISQHSLCSSHELSTVNTVPKQNGLI